MGSSSSASSIQSYLYNEENQEQFIISMNSTSPLFSDSLKNSSIVRSQANSVNCFCFFTIGNNRSLKFWQLKNFFVISLQVKNPKIKPFHAIVHNFKDAKFLSTYIDKVAYANMISFMDNVSASISRDLYITRILDLYKNNDSLLYSKVYPLHRIRFAEPFLDIAEPTLLGRTAHRYAQDESFSTTTSEHPSNLAVNSEFFQMSSTNNESESLSNSASISKKRNQKTNQNKSAPELQSRSFDVWTTNANDTTTFLDSTSEFNPNKSKSASRKIPNSGDDSQLSSCINPLSEPESIDKSGLSTILNSSYSDYDESMANKGVFSSSLQTISEPGLYESSVSQTFKDAKKMRSKIRLHKHHNLDTDHKADQNSESNNFSTSSKVTVSESFFSPSSNSRSENSSRSGRSGKRSNRNRRRKGEDDDSIYSISYSDRSVASRASKISIFKDSSSVAPSFISETAISSTGQPSKRKRNVGVEIDLRHDVGFTSSEKSGQIYEYEQSERESSFSSRKSSRSSNRSRSRSRRNNHADDSFNQNDFSDRIRNRKKNITPDFSKSQTETMIDSD